MEKLGLGRFFSELALALKRFPWKEAVYSLRERFRDDRLGISASSLTFTTMIALVPFVTVMLAIMTALPIFSKLQDVFQRWLVDSLVPEAISKQMLGYITMFAKKASKVGFVGAMALLFSSLTLIYTIERTFNNIWRVQRPRAWPQRLLRYWAALTLGPLILASSIAFTSQAISLSSGVVEGSWPRVWSMSLALLEFFMLSGGLAVLYYYVPHAKVRMHHAAIGALLAAALLQLGKKLLAQYIQYMPTYSVVYGTFATLPILMIWIYQAWVIVLLGAEIAAHLPEMIERRYRRLGGAGASFQMAIEIIGFLADARGQAHKGLTLEQLASRMRLDASVIQRVVEELMILDWVGLIAPYSAQTDGRLVLLADLDQTLIYPLLDKLLLQNNPSTRAFAENAGWFRLTLSDLSHKRQMG